jgi:hypothetical protein
MELKLKLENDLKDALRSGDEVRKNSIRMILAAVKLAQVEKGAALDDQAIIGLIQKEIKSRKESIADAEKANRPDIIASSLSEIKVLEVYLPAQLSIEELTTLVDSAIDEVGATQPGDMGKVMKIIMPKVQGRAPNDQVSLLVRQFLEKK